MTLWGFCMSVRLYVCMCVFCVCVYVCGYIVRSTLVEHDIVHGVILHCEVSPTMPNPTMLPTVGLIDTQITPINTVGLNLLAIPLPSLCHFGAFKKHVIVGLTPQCKKNPTMSCSTYI